MLQTYQHDLKEFGIGLKKETEVITGATAHVVKDLPSTLETGATVAQVRIIYYSILTLILLSFCHFSLESVLRLFCCLVPMISVVGLLYSFSLKLEALK